MWGDFILCTADAMLCVCWVTAVVGEQQMFCNQE